MQHCFMPFPAYAAIMPACYLQMLYELFAGFWVSWEQ